MVAEPAATSMTKSAKKRLRQARVRACNEKQEADSHTTPGNGKELRELDEFEAKDDISVGTFAAAEEAEPGQKQETWETSQADAGAADEEKEELITSRLARLAIQCEGDTPSRAIVQEMLLNLVEREGVLGDPGDIEGELMAELGKWM